MNKTEDPEVKALFQIIESLASVGEDRRQAIVESAMFWCRGRAPNVLTTRGRPRGSRNKPVNGTLPLQEQAPK